MRIFVTGATGFLGKRIVYKLKEQGFYPVALGRNEKIGLEFQQNGIPFISLDLKDREKVLRTFEGGGMVVHSAGLSTVWGTLSDFRQANVTAVSYLLEACRLHHIEKLVHISTPSLYFNYLDRYNIKESDPLPKKFVNNYALSKKEGEDLVNQAYQEGLDTTILRPRGLFGPGDTSVFPRLLCAIEKNMLPLINNGQALIDVTYVDNVAEAVILALKAGEVARGKTYNITNDEPQTFLSLIEALCSKMGRSLKARHLSYATAASAAWLLETAYRLFHIKKEPPLTQYTVGLLAKSMTLDITRAKEDLGYHPKIKINDGLDLFISSLRK